MYCIEFIIFYMVSMVTYMSTGSVIDWHIQTETGLNSENIKKVP